MIVTVLTGKRGGPTWNEVEEQRRISLGIRRPFHWVARRTTAGRKHEGQPCAGCDQWVERGQAIIIETDLNCAIEARRYRYWHLGHDPRSVERALNRVARQRAKKTSSRDQSGRS